MDIDMADIIGFGGETKLPVPVERVLEGALKAHREKPFDRVIIIACYTEDGDVDYEAASEADAAINAWDAARFIRGLHKRADDVPKGH
jgi:hypothetical protein